MHLDLEEISLRPMVESDITSVMEVVRECFIRPYSPEFCCHFLKEPGKFAVVAEWNEVIVGLMFYELQPDHLYLGLLAVAPWVQARGVGRKMMAWLQAELPKHDRHAIELHAYCRDVAPEKLYRSVGFQHAETIPNYYPDGVAAFRMRFQDK